MSSWQIFSNYNNCHLFQKSKITNLCIIGTINMLLRAESLDKESKRMSLITGKSWHKKNYTVYCYNWDPTITIYYSELLMAISILHNLTQLTILSSWVWNAFPPVCLLLHFPVLSPRKPSPRPRYSYMSCKGNRLSKHCT